MESDKSRSIQAARKKSKTDLTDQCLYPRIMFFRLCRSSFIYDSDEPVIYVGFFSYLHLLRDWHIYLISFGMILSYSHL